MQKRRSKYNAKRVTYFGFTFDSKREGLRYLELRTLMGEGKISHLEMQVRYDFRVNDILVSYYKADFRYIDVASGKTVVEDVKGMKTPMYNLKKKWLLAEYGIQIKET